MAKTPVYNLKAEKVSEITLPKSTFGVDINDDIVVLCVRAYLANSRSAHAKVKDVGEISGTTKKMWAQKGTGRARHGSSKFGLFVGGASAHGPQGNQTFTQNINQKTRVAAVNSLFSKFAKKDLIMVVDDFSSLPPKTKEAWKFVDLLEKVSEPLAKSKKIGIITTTAESNVNRAFGNIPGFSFISLNSLNVYDLSNQNFLIISQKAVETFK